MYGVGGTNDHGLPFVWFTAAAFWIRGAGGARKGLGGHDWGAPNHQKISDGTSSSLRWCSSVVYVHQNELVHWTSSISSVVQFFPKNRKEWLNRWTSLLNLELVKLACIQAMKYYSSEKLPNLFPSCS